MEMSEKAKPDKDGRQRTKDAIETEAAASGSKPPVVEKKKTAPPQSSSKSNKHGVFDPCVFGKTKLWIPQEMKNDPSVFHEVVSMATWENSFTSEEKSTLNKLLPTFTENNEDEQKETLRRLFEGENFRFGNPLNRFEQDLSMGRYGVDSVEKQRAWQRLQREECRLQNSHRLQSMLPEVLIKRQELLEVVQFTSPSEYIKKPQQTVTKSTLESKGKEKYEKLLEDLSQELGESLLSDEEMENGICSDEDEDFQLPWEDRLQRLFDSPSKISHNTLTRKTSSSEINGTSNGEKSPKPEFNLVTEKDYMKMLERMQIVKEDGIDHPEFIFSHITLPDIINRTYPVKIRSQEDANALKRKRKKEKDDLKTKKKKKTPTSSPKPSTPVSVISSQDSLQGIEIPSSPESANVPQEPTPTAIKREETQQPPPPPTSAAAAPPPVSAPLPQGSPDIHNKVQYQVPHSFFALLRKYFNMTMNHQLWVSDLQEKVNIWEKSPVSALCPWRPLQSTWSKVIENTLYFLSLEEQGKLVSYLEEEDAWIWPDPMSVPNDHLTMLFKRWLDLMLRVQPVVSPMSGKDGTLVIPEPRMYTDYTVRSSSEEEINQFRIQELQRFSEPQKPFTYCQHGYESVVGPVKGITPMDPLPASKGREHSLLISDRPSYVTILSLVRDAVARLPNGEGTKVEICHLLKESQFIAPNAEANLLAAVSGALDRLHNEKDPSVKFDATRKLWVYLHRNRSMKNFERIQIEQMMASRTKKSSNKSKQGSQLRVPPLDYSADFTTSGSESSSPSLDLSNRSSPGNSRSHSPRVPPHSPRSSAGHPEAKDQSKLFVTGKTTTAPSERSFSGAITPGAPFPDPHMDPNISTIQSLISESLIKSQLMRKPYQRSKTPPASIGRSNTSGHAPAAKKAQTSSPGGMQRSMSIPASWPHLTQSAAGDLMQTSVLPSQNQVKPATRKDDSTPGGKKSDYGSKIRSNSPRTNSGEKKSSVGVKSKSKGEKSKSSKSSSSEKKSPTVQLKSGAITVTLPSSALKGQTVRSILASAASITIGNSTAQQGEEQSHPTVQAVRKRLLAEKNQNTKAKQVKQAEVKVPTGADNSDQTQPPKVDPKRAALPTIILRPTSSSFMGQTAAVSKDGTVSQTQQLSAQPLTFVGAKPSGVITGLASPQTPSSKPLPLSLVVSAATSKATPSVSKTAPFIQQGNIPIPSLAPGQNIILQMPDGSKFVTSIPANSATAATVAPKKPSAAKLAKPPSVGSVVGKAGVGNVLQPAAIVTGPRNQQLTPQQGRVPTTSTSSLNPYEFDDDQDIPRPVLGKPFLAPSSVLNSPPQSNPVFAVTSNTTPVQRFALNLVTKQGNPSRKHGNVVTTGSNIVRSTSSSLAQTGLVRGTLAPSGPLRGTIIQTGPLKGAAVQTGISVGAVPQASLLKGTGKAGLVKAAVSQSSVVKAVSQTGLQKVAVPQAATLKDANSSQTRIVNTVVSPHGQLKAPTPSQAGNVTPIVSQSASIKDTVVAQTRKGAVSQSGGHQVTLTHPPASSGSTTTTNPSGHLTQARAESVIIKPTTREVSSPTSKGESIYQTRERSGPMTGGAQRNVSEVTGTKSGSKYRLVESHTSQKNSVERMPSNTQTALRAGQQISRASPRSSAVIPAGRMSHRTHSSPGILRKTQDHSRKLHANRPAMRVTKAASIGAPQHQQISRTEISSSNKEKKPPDGSSLSGNSPERQTLTPRNKSFDDAPSKEEELKKNTSIILGSSLTIGGDSSRSEMEGQAKTAKLIKSQELAEAVSGDMSKQGGQEQT